MDELLGNRNLAAALRNEMANGAARMLAAAF
jgi:hypothetical protein